MHTLKSKKIKRVDDLTADDSYLSAELQHRNKIAKLLNKLSHNDLLEIAEFAGVPVFLYGLKKRTIENLLVVLSK